jgi:hypothetical protein
MVLKDLVSDVKWSPSKVWLIGVAEQPVQALGETMIDVQCLQIGW